MLPETVFGGYESDQFLFQTFSTTKGEAMFLSHCCPSCPGNNAAITVNSHSQQQYHTSPGWSMTALGPPSARSLKISTSSWRPVFVFVFISVEFVFFRRRISMFTCISICVCPGLQNSHTLICFLSHY